MTKATDVLVDVNPGTAAEQQREPVASSSLVSWVMTRVAEWEDHRRTNFDKRWDEYYRMWRGMWSHEDKNRESERSRLIHPALSQAVESAVSELEQATFGQGKWFDVADNVMDEKKVDIELFRGQMSEDFEKENVEGAFSESFLNGAIYGTLIGKIVMQERTVKTIEAEKIGQSDILRPKVVDEARVHVGLVAVHPKEFVIDPAARTVNEGLGCAHITDVPKHEVSRKQSNGIYYSVPLSHYSDTLVVGDNTKETINELSESLEKDKTKLIEYHGFVPKYLLDGVETEMSTHAEESEWIWDESDQEELIEAIVTIANGGTLLRAVSNPYMMSDRSFIAAQFDTVPNRFWGRGICEKGYNPQKGLDAEMRGRIDAMALSIHPMMAMDATRMHRGADLRVSPGRNLLTNGDPKSVLMPLNFGQVNNNTFSQSADLERQIQMATGSMDSATPVGDNRRNETLGGMSIIQGASIKRTRRTMANIERNFTKPFIHKAAWRFMQFAPERYPVEDVEFQIHSTLGIMAREMEQNQLANMMKTVPAESPAFWMLLKGIFEHSDLSNREQMLPIIDQMTELSLQKQANPEPDPLIQVQMREIEVKAELEQAKLQQKADKDNKDLALEVQRLQLEVEELRLKREKIILDAQVALAGQEQDSLVTAAQMMTSEQDSIRKAVVQLEKVGS